MDSILNFIQILLHLNLYLGQFINQYGAWTFALLFIVIFCETGLVVTPFLPGDSLLFACGAIFASSELNVHWLVFTLSLAAFTGDNCNYWAGRFFGHRVFSERSWVFKPQYREMTKNFYAEYGGKAIIIARFLPLFRTFVPFFAGISQMDYKRYLAFSISSAILWVALLTYAGYWFGNIPFIKNNFSIATIAIIVISLLPACFSMLRKFCIKK
jgi:membrane-associated protein